MICALPDCEVELTGRRRKFCSDAHSIRFRNSAKLNPNKKKHNDADQHTRRREWALFRRVNNAHKCRAGGPGLLLRDWKRLKARYDHSCFYCHLRADLTMDHVIPVSRGGLHSIGNVVPACMECNLDKGTMLLIEWKRYQRVYPEGWREEPF